MQNSYVANNVEGVSGPLSYVLGTGYVAQILLALIIATIVYILLITFEMVYKSFSSMAGTYVDVVPYTVSAQDKPIMIEQNPSLKDHKMLPLSDNERTGAEFTYSFFLWINPSSFNQTEGLLHIMHKGHPVPFPLMGPGVFLKSNTNTLRVYMNSSKTWNNYVDVENIPVKKWVHVVLIARDNCIEVYINGNLIKKLNLKDSVLYQNFGNLYLFNQRHVTLPRNLPSLKDEQINIMGTFSGNISNLRYYTYALSYTEIQSETQVGPSSKVVPTSQDQPPYLEDSWWVSSYSR